MKVHQNPHTQSCTYEHKEFESSKQQLTALELLATKVQPKINGDYESRLLACCQFCGDKYNVGEKIPRILIHCGHTFCTECLSQLHHNFRVRCPACRKLIKNLESVERLPLNINILYEVVERDPILAEIDYDDETPESIQSKLCRKHNDRIMHFYCSNHSTVFCRECIKDYHTEEKCFVVDLYEIEKMRKLQSQNMSMNINQLKKRKDGSDQSCILDSDIKPKEKKEKPVHKIHLQRPPHAMMADYATGNSQGLPLNLPAGVDPSMYLAAVGKAKLDGINDFGYSGYNGDHYGNEEEPTDEARTNEEAYEELQQQLQGQAYGQRGIKGIPGGGNCIFFNEEHDDDQLSGDDDQSSDQDEEDDEDHEEEEDQLEDGEFDPSIIACQNLDGQQDSNDEDY